MDLTVQVRPAHGVRQPLLFVLVFLAAAEILFLGAGYLAHTLAPNAPEFVFTDASEAAMLLLALAALYKLRWFQRAGFNGRAQWRDLRVLWLPALISLLFLSGLLPARHDSPVQNVVFVLSVVLIGLSEEAVFRGVTLEALLPYGKYAAMFGSAILFGLYHFDNLIQAGSRSTPADVLLTACFAALIGVAYAGFRLRVGTIWVVVLFHAVSDLPALFLPNATATGLVNLSTALMFTAIGLVMAGYGVFLVRAAKV